MNLRPFHCVGLMAVFAVSLAIARIGGRTPPTLDVGSQLNLGQVAAPASQQHDGISLTKAARIQASDIHVIVFLSVGCPISNSYIPELNQISQQFERQDIRFLGIVPGNHMSGEEVAEFQRDFNIDFVVAHDPNGHFVRQFQATHTPEAFVVRNGKVVYRGRIDDSWLDYGERRSNPIQRELYAALQSVIADKSIAVAKTQPVGCLIESPGNRIKQPDQRNITFARHIAPMLFDHCTRCHRPGEAAPFSLLSYDDAASHAEQMRIMINRRLMPPWKAEPNFGSFKNEHRLSDVQIAGFNQWVESGLPMGDAVDMPAAPKFSNGWQLGQPDLELIMPEAFTIPADGPDIYRHFVLPSGLTQNKLVAAVEFRPGSAEVVHHAFMYFDTTGQGRRLDELDPGPGYSRIGTPGFPVTGSLGGWGPGGLPRRLPDQYGLPLNKQSDLVVQIHYHPSGRQVKDQSRIGLHFADSATHWVTEILVSNVELKIPAGDKRHHHQAEYTLPVDTLMLDATPHMHTLGQEVKVEAYLPNGTRQPLVWIKDWDFDWQESYVFADSLLLPKGTRIQLDCWYDNSSDNPRNPNSPPLDVEWGDFSTDEMGICYFQVTTNTLDDFVSLKKHAGDYFQRQWDHYQQAVNARQQHITRRQSSGDSDSSAVRDLSSRSVEVQSTTTSNR